MTATLPEPREALQLCRLRALRVQRARQRCSQAQAEVEAAAHAVRERQRQIERCRREIDALALAIVHQLAPQLPRWSGMAAAQRERLADRLERAEFALVGDEEALEQAQERLQQARAELTRALAREDAVLGLAQQARRARLLARERRVESEIEDQARAPAPAPHRKAA